MTDFQINEYLLNNADVSKMDRNGNIVYTVTVVPTYEMQLQSVNKKGDNLYYIKNKTQELCLAAVKQDGTSLCFIENTIDFQTEEIYLEAVK